MIWYTERKMSSDALGSESRSPGPAATVLGQALNLSLAATDSCSPVHFTATLGLFLK